MYLLDANVFITAKNNHYGFDLCPGFWDWIRAAYSEGIVLSVDQVRQELAASNDDLSQWAKTMPASFFKSPDVSTTQGMRDLSRWTQQSKYEQTAILTFLQGADYYLIAEAMASDFTVVTHEVRANTSKKIKIPNACDEVQVDCISPYEMLRNENVQFVLSS